MKGVCLILCVMAVLSGSALCQVPVATQPQTPLDVVIQFLSFSESQAAQFRQAFASLQKALSEIQPRIAAKQQELNALLSVESPGDANVGKVLLETRTLHREQERAIQQYHSAFVSLLMPEQMERVARVSQARELLPAVSVFAAVYLVNGQ